jgi:hypothetical protein
MFEHGNLLPWREQLKRRSTRLSKNTRILAKIVKMKSRMK